MDFYWVTENDRKQQQSGKYMGVILIKKDYRSGYEEVPVGEGAARIRLRKGIKQGKKGVFHLLFSRIGVLAILVLIQFVFLMIPFVWIQNYSTLFLSIYTVMAVAVLIVILNRDINPGFKLMWVIPMAAFPVFGAFFYIFVQAQPGARRFNQKYLSNVRETEPYLKQNEAVLSELAAEDPHAARLATYIEEKAKFPIYENSSVKYYPIGELMFEDLKIQLKKAKRYIFLEYFIIAHGEMWGEVLDILLEKIAEGVEVYLMYDGTNTLSNLPVGYEKKMEALGIHCHVVQPIRVALSTVQNNRDHRKICVIDGNTAFTGGVNLADEYINVIDRFGHWKDTAVRIQGEAVKSFLFAWMQMWNVGAKEKLSYEKYLNLTIPLEVQAPGYVIPFSDSPLDQENVGESVYVDMIYSANEYVHFMSPYLVPDNEVLTALKYAAKRGVEVVLILPHIPDKKYAFYLAKTYYPSLLEAGVNIYEYTPGFVHAKDCVCDGKSAVVGTINLDYRSLYLHFECAVWMYGMPEIAKIEEDFQVTMGLSQKITMEDYLKLPFYVKLFGGVLKLMAPLM
ncbi:MAG: cardiolipin synthase [Lachnospiraceae bacterium]|nr:cardiolipin synthase [Lachnospiraceae bacterium]